MVSIVPRTRSSIRVESPLESLRSSEARNVSMWLLGSPGDRCWTLHNHWPELSWRCIRRKLTRDEIKHAPDYDAEHWSDDTPASSTATTAIRSAPGQRLTKGMPSPPHPVA